MRLQTNQNIKIRKENQKHYNTYKPGKSNPSTFGFIALAPTAKINLSYFTSYVSVVTHNTKTTMQKKRTKKEQIDEKFYET